MLKKNHSPKIFDRVDNILGLMTKSNVEVINTFIVEGSSRLCPFFTCFM